MFSAEVSWRHEPGINHAYVWLSDGTVVGYRDLDTGTDHPAAPEHRELVRAVTTEWIAATGAPGVDTPREPDAPDLRRVGRLRWLRRRRLQRDHARSVVEHRRWRLDHPSWRIPVDPPNGGWRDLVRHEPGQALWAHAAELSLTGSGSAPTSSSSWQVGALGEEAVARELLTLTHHSPWRFVHSVPVGHRGSDIDHVLVGPGGVFTLNTKAHRDRTVWQNGEMLIVDGVVHPYLRNSRHEAARAARLLSRACGRSVHVHPLIVVVEPRALVVRDAPADVTLIASRDLGPWLASLPVVLDHEAVDRLFSVVRRSTTWAEATSP